jgi:hypothetical protein
VAEVPWLYESWVPPDMRSSFGLDHSMLPVLDPGVKAGAGRRESAVKL